MKIKRLFFLYVLIVLLWFTTGLRISHGADPIVDVLPDLVETAMPSVVNISSTRFVKSVVLRGMPEFLGLFGVPEEYLQKQSSLGSGFVWDQNGYIITNNHVIENAQEVVVTFFDKSRSPAQIIGRDPVLDVALLKLKNYSDVKKLKPVTFGDSDKVRIGESVFAIGNPMGLQHTVTKGIISAKHRTIGLGPLDNLLQTDASINPGNSGGPLFNFKGEVIGINTAMKPDAQLISFAIPVNEAKEALEEIRKYGQVARVWLGIMGEQITVALQQYYGLPVAYGIVVTRLVQSSPAHQNGLQAGDIIISVNDLKVQEQGDLQRILAKLKPGNKIKLNLNRKGRNITKEFAAKQAPLGSSKLPEGIM